MRNLYRESHHVIHLADVLSYAFFEIWGANIVFLTHRFMSYLWLFSDISNANARIASAMLASHVSKPNFVMFSGNA